MFFLSCVCTESPPATWEVQQATAIAIEQGKLLRPASPLHGQHANPEPCPKFSPAQAKHLKVRVADMF